MDCDHPFVRYRLGAYVCEECGQAFAQHPANMKARKSDATILSYVKSFIEGNITYVEALLGTGLDNTEFRSCLNNAIPKKFIMMNQYTLGQEGGTPVVVGVEPHRTSDPELIESFFSSPRNGFIGTTPGDIIKVANQQFPDIKSLDVEVDAHGVCVCMITFVDDTCQRVHLQ